MADTHDESFPYPLPATAFVLFAACRLAVATTWGWSALTKLAGPGVGWFDEALAISRTHTGIPGWTAVADVLLANVGLVFVLVVAWELYLMAMMLLGFVTRLHGLLATLWSLVVAVLAFNVPKTGAAIPPSFPVPIGGWLWLLGPLVLFPLVVFATRSGRLWGLDARLRPRWEGRPGWRGTLARWM